VATQLQLTNISIKTPVLKKIDDGQSTKKEDYDSQIYAVVKAL
jgi:hypothetical protein